MVSDHALQQHRNRNGLGQATDLKIAANLRNIAAYGKEYVLKDEVTKVKQLLAHDCKEARYFKDGQVMVVVEDNTIVTSHHATHKKWIPKT